MARRQATPADGRWCGKRRRLFRVRCDARRAATAGRLGPCSTMACTLISRLQTIYCKLTERLPDVVKIPVARPVKECLELGTRVEQDGPVWVL